MLVFVTGASGYIGSVVCKELAAHGHKILALARSDASAEKLEAAGYEILRGDLFDLDALRRGAEAADATIHLAYDHSTALQDYAASGKTDLQAIKALTSSSSPTSSVVKTFLMTSGTLMVPGRKPLAYETDPGTLEGFAAIRLEPEQYTISLSSPPPPAPPIHTGAIRVPPVVHSSHDTGFMLKLHQIARDKGFSGYIGEGTNVWPTVQVDDLGSLYRLALEKVVDEPGIRIHAVAEQGVEFKEIAKAVGQVLGLPTKSISQEEAAEHFGFLGMIVGVDNPTSNELTKARLGWKPVGSSLLEDIRAGHYLNNELKWAL